MTGQDLLDTMEVLNAELQLQAGEGDVAKGLLALNVAQDYFETLAAQRGKLLESSTGTVATVNATETTAFPSGLLRIDRLQKIGTNNLPAYDLTPIRRSGGHIVSRFWPLNLTSTIGSGAPTGYWTNGSLIYWNPIPDNAYTIRWYGFQRAASITEGGTFAYDDGVALPMASFACQLIKMGLDDQANDLSALASGAFGAVLDTLSLGNRDGAVGLEYTHIHTE